MNRGVFGRGGGGGGGGGGLLGVTNVAALRPPETTAPTADYFAQKHNRITAAMDQLESLSGMCCKS